MRHPQPTAVEVPEQKLTFTGDRIMPHQENPYSGGGVIPCCAIGIIVAIAGLPLTATAEGAGPIEEIVVTGSRIARDPNLGAAGPVQSISAQDIRLSGEIDVTDVLREMPALLTTTSAESSVDGIFATDTTSVGQSVLQLRGLGPERTLVLVDGRRHVAGVEGSQSVDVGTIPEALIERVEILTGGASAIYGADAVTGVVNFILKDDFEGLDLNFNAGMAGEGDGETYKFSGLFGQNFADGRGNFTVGLDVSKRKRIKFGDRSFSENNGVADDLPNPALRFQSGDIDAATTPNFQQFYAFDNGNHPTGFTIPSADAFIASYQDSFGATPTLTAAELALIERAANAPLRLIRSQPTFSISSNRGVIAPADFLLPGVDLDANGIDDCLDSSVGFQSLLEDVNSFGFAGGCWVLNDDGTARPYRDGLVASTFNQFGGDGIQNDFDQDLLIPDEDKYAINVSGRYEFADSLVMFAEAKYVHQEVEFGGPLNTFYDLLTVAPDNPFIPVELQQVATDSGGLFITRDPTDLGRNIEKNTRETTRIVLGIEGELANGWNYEVSGNWGNFERQFKDRNAVIQDRWFAAIDVISDAAGNPICRSDVDPTPPPTTPFGIPAFDPGFFTFNPGDGQCRPANILAGPGGISQEAVDFITTTATSEYDIEQLVFSASLAGELEFVSLPGGNLGFAVGTEYREEKSKSTFDPLVLGIVPVDTPDAAAGTLVRDLDNAQNALVFDPEFLASNSSGEYDVAEVFGEVSLPLLADVMLARELTLDAAARWSDYSTIGSATTWKVGLSWSPVDDIRFRGTISEAIRAPNIFELFEPDQGATYRPFDPCDQDSINALLSSGDPRGPIREANCRADGIPPGFNDPLSARFSGVTSGNEELEEETADSYTIGFVFQPQFLDGLTVSVDYWDIEIESAIEAVDDQDIVDNCYDSANFPNQYCELFERNDNPASPQFLGFNFLRQTEVNFGKLEATGVDFNVQYAFDVGTNAFELGVSGTWMDELNNFFDPGDASAVDPELGELQRPEWAGTLTAAWRRGPLAVRWQTFYMDEQALRAVEIEDVESTFGSAGIEDEFYSHDLSISYDIDNRLQLYGGVNNVTDEEPFLTEQVFPVNPRGRFFFLGVSYAQ
jgi:outer membrane receptor protein involved in Fe transport